MKTFTNRVPYKEFLSIVPHPVIIESLTNKYPVVIEKVEGIAKRRHTLGKIIPKLQHVQMKEYGYHTGLLKNENLVHTHVNPLVDQVTAPSKHEEEKYPETYRKHAWPQVEGYQEAVRDIFGVIQQCAHVMAGHLDGHVIKTLKPDASKYQSLVQMTKESQMTTARSFYYRERRASEDGNKPSFNFHYDRMNMSACIKDFFYLNGQEIEQPDGAGLIFNTKNKERYQLRLKEDEVGFHIGMTYHILSAGIIPAHAHAVYLPNTEGLSRASQAFFFSPSPHIEITPPVQFDNIASSLPEDEGVVPKHIGLTNWQPGMKYTDWNEAIVRGFKKVFFNE